MKEITDEKYRNIESNYAHGAGGRDDPFLRRSAPPGLRRFDQARAVQALVWAVRLVAGGLRDRSESGRRVGAPCCGAPTAGTWACAAFTRRSCRRSASSAPSRLTITRASRSTPWSARRPRKNDAYNHVAVPVAGDSRRGDQVRHGARRGGVLRQTR